MLEDGGNNADCHVSAPNMERETAAVFLIADVDFDRPVLALDVSPRRIGEVCGWRDLSELFEYFGAFAKQGRFEVWRNILKTFGLRRKVLHEYVPTHFGIGPQRHFAPLNWLGHTTEQIFSFLAAEGTSSRFGLDAAPAPSLLEVREEQLKRRRQCYQVSIGARAGLNYRDTRCGMATVTIRKLNDDALLEIKRRAKEKGRSTEAEMREILEKAARPNERYGLGSAIRNSVMRNGGGFDLQIVRDQTPMRIVDFSGPEFDRPEFEEEEHHPTSSSETE